MINACYLLFTDGGRRTYTGATHDPDRRLRQHNRELVGGASATAGKTWSRALYVHGFPDWTATLQFEWMWKRKSRAYHGLSGKIRGLLELLESGKSTSSSAPFCTYVGGRAYIDVAEAHLNYLGKIESFRRLLFACGLSPQTLTTSFPYAFKHLSSSSSKMSSSIIS